MYDAVTPANIPADAQMVAGYIDGHYQSFAGIVERCPNAIAVPVAVWPSTNDGIVLDVETGDAVPQQAPAWVQMRRAAGVIPTVYCSESWWPQVRQAFRDQGVDEPYYWIAAYPGPGEVLYDDPLCVAHQWGGDVDGGYDISVVADHWPGVDNGAQPQPGANDLDAAQAQMLQEIHNGIFDPNIGLQHALIPDIIQTRFPAVMAELHEIEAKVGVSTIDVEKIRAAVRVAVLAAPYATTKNRQRLAEIAAGAVTS